MVWRSFTQNACAEETAGPTGLATRWIGTSKLDEKCKKQEIDTVVARCDAGLRI
jgi:hypothetical protein